MSTSTVGQIQEFQPELECITSYIERLNLFLAANDIADRKRVPVLLSVIGAKIYTLLRNLMAPTLPQDATFDDLVKILKTHFEPQPVIIAERFHFHRRTQAVGETISDYIAQLRKLTLHCKYGDHLDDALRDQFVCGIRNDAIQKRLLSEPDLTLIKAMQIAQGMEAADQTAKALKGTEAVVQKVTSSKPSLCYRCGRTNHTSSDCKFKDAKCHKCGKIGHIATVCRSRPKQYSNFTRHNSGHHRNSQLKAKWINAEKTEDIEEVPLYTIWKRAAHPITVDVSVNNKLLLMEVDTGAAVSIISENTQKRMFPEATLHPTSVLLKTYSGERLAVIGELQTQVHYKDQTKVLNLLVVEGDGPSLLGRDWLKHIQLDWKQITTIVQETHGTLNALLQTHVELFKDELGTANSVQVRLQVKPDAQPKFCKARPVPFAIKSAIEQELDRLESSGILEKISHSDWAAPIVAVPKKDGKFRICGDYKVSVNQVLEVDQYPLPKPEDLFATLAGGKKFSKLDLSQAYQQLPLNEESMSYAVINTHKGLYRYTRLPFGIASAPAVFQKFMDTMLQGIPHVICFIDDILVTGKDDNDHLQNLAKVFQILQQNGLRLKQDKCKFLQYSVEYLGHKIDAEGIHATTEKMDAVMKAPIPRNVSELRSFLGLLNYYGKFLPNLSTILHPLNQLLQTGHHWKWDARCHSAFKLAKDTLHSAQVLVHYNPSLPLKLAADASAYGIGAVISHVLPDGNEKPIAFASRTLSPSEKNYAQLEKEALALIYGVKKFHQYLYSRRFTLITDHKPLMTILSPKKGIPSLAAARLQRWALFLSAYTYDIEFKSSQDHANADCLSRLPLEIKDSVDYLAGIHLFNIAQMESLPVTCQQVQTATRNDPLLSKILLFTKQGWPTQVQDEFKPFFSRRQELSVEDECLLWGIRVIIPKKLQQHVLQELHRDHPGMTRMKCLARSFLWWPGLDKDIENLVKSCLPCQSEKPSPAAAPLHPWVWPTKPWQRIHVDFAGPFMGSMYLVVVDAHSKWPEVYEMSSTTVAKTITVLRHIFAAYGLPEQVVSDNGPQFSSKDFAVFMKENGVKHIKSAPYHPSSNGAAERFVQTFKSAMKAGSHENRTLPHLLENFLLTYRTSPHATTNQPPCILFLNRSLRTRLDLLRPNIGSYVSRKQSNQVAHHDQHTKERSFSLTQQVMVRNFRPGATWIPGVIIRKLGPITYLVNVQGKLCWKRHIDHIRSCGEDLTPSTVGPPVDGSLDLEDDYSVPVRFNPQEDIPPDNRVTTSQNSSSTTDSPNHRYPHRERRPPNRFMFETY